jgi:ADP-heptose:LPS heptosyltransferase
MGDSLPEINASLVEAAGGRSRSLQPTYTVPDRDDREAESRLRHAGAWPGRVRIAVHPGGTYPTQRWPLERFAEAARALASRRDGQVVVLCGPGEQAQATLLGELLGDVAVVATPGSVGDLAAALGRCDLLLANNSGPLHLAAAIGLPTVSTMGPTDPVRFWPWGRSQSVLRRDDLPCSPCTRGRCRSHECLRKIAAEEMVRAAESLLERTADGVPGVVRRAGA